MAEPATLIKTLEDLIPAALTKFDAFPKLPKAYKARSESRGFLTLGVLLLALLLMLNDIGEYLYGWPDHEFGVDMDTTSFLPVNLDMTVNMPCHFLSVDLRDAMGDRLFLTGGFRRDGTFFDVGQATALKEHAAALSANQAIAQSRKSRGFFSFLTWKKPKTQAEFKPTYNHQEDGSACRIWGTMFVKRVTANLHVTTLGHGYASYEHVDHKAMNLSHVISEFSFGPYFPSIVQPLDNSFEVTDKNFVAYQYFLHIVPTVYVTPSQPPLHTHQYSVTHYTKELDHHRGTPGIFFKFEIDPIRLTHHQRTTTFLQLLIRCVGVIGGVFVCTSYAIRITTRAVEVVSGADQSPGLVAAESSGVKVGGLRAKWGGSELRSRPGASARPGWSSPYAGTTPATASYGAMPSPYLASNSNVYSNSSNPGTPMVPATPHSSIGLGYPATPSYPATPGSIRTSASLGPPPMRTPSYGSNGHGSPGLVPPSPLPGGEMGSVPGTPGVYATFPPTPGPGGSGFNVGPPPRKAAKKDD
ncbi:endoplasmic reticulum-golgi intermediate compartment protein 2 [Ephemerocybe angulata]|uniref:Endoplasmic reticulum-golgi intermediate compartment protein 2 n=1 Tax=Ephemerocybe angulata TaxID=980116 RepID=A0A8H6I6D5_9AGAR|nr:endoplasmic reticulum-golgi intermediate compartment protein 2 [Tulosesus angulatus]